jgi:hypothetical protein
MAQPVIIWPVTAEDRIQSRPIQVAMRSKAWVCGRCLTGIVGSNPSRDRNVCVVCCIRAIIWNISAMKKEGGIQMHKMDETNKQEEDKNPR